MNKKKKRFPWGLLIFLLIVLGVGGFFGIRYVQAQATPTGLPSNLTTVAVVNGNLAATIGTSGNVRAYQTATLSWGSSGRVGQINVKLGQKVQAGDILASLDPSSFTSSSMITAQSDLLTAQKALADLKTSIDKTAIAQAQQAVVAAQQAVADAQTARDLLNYSRATGGNLDAAYAQLYIAQDNLTKAQQRYDNVVNRADTDPVKASALAAVVSAQQAVYSKQQSVNWYLSAPSSSDIAQADATLELKKAQLADAQTNYDTVKSGPTDAQIVAAQAKVDLAKITVNQRYIIAPFSGTVTVLNSKLGDLVSGSTQSMRIDDLSNMLVDLSISEVDISRLSIGQIATLIFDAYPSKTYNGVVDAIGQIGSTSSGAVNFTVTVRLTDADSNVKPGMTASANIVLEAVSNVLLVPNKGIRTQGNSKYVMVLQNGVINSIVVKVGLSNDTQSQVTSQTLVAGDKIVTNPLSDLQKNGQNLFNALRIPGAGAGGVGVPGGGDIPAGGFPGGGFPGGGDTGGGRPNGPGTGGGTGGGFTPPTGGGG